MVNAIWSVCFENRRERECIAILDFSRQKDVMSAARATLSNRTFLATIPNKFIGIIQKIEESHNLYRRMHCGCMQTEKRPRWKHGKDGREEKWIFKKNQ